MGIESEDRGWKIEDRVGAQRYRAIFYPLLSILLLLLTGCSAFGILAYKIAGPPKIPARYVPAKTPMLVLAENRKQPSATVGPEVLSAYVVEELTLHNVAPIIPAEKLQSLRDSKLAAFRDMSLSAVGKAVEANQILYIEVDHDSVMPLSGGEAMQGQVQVRVKVIDVATGKTLWPTDLADGAALNASSALGTASSHGTITDVRRRMYASLADQIARLFYKWQPEDERPQD